MSITHESGQLLRWPYKISYGSERRSEADVTAVAALVIHERLRELLRGDAREDMPQLKPSPQAGFQNRRKVCDVHLVI